MRKKTISWQLLVLFLKPQKKNISTFLFLQKYDEAEKGEMLQKRR